MDYNEAIKELEEVKQYICNTITDAQAVCRAHDNAQQVDDTLYSLTGAARDLIMIATEISLKQRI